MFTFVSWINWGPKEAIVNWIDQTVFREKPRGPGLGNGLFNVLLSILVAVAWVWTGLALIYLWSS
jgi:hypothetical protein